MALLSAGLIMMLSLSFAESQVIPASYSFTDGVSVNGSSATGKCSSVTNSSGTITCTDPTSSVLYDGHIPTLTGLDGDMWASQLLTQHTTTHRINITFESFSISKFTMMVRVEVVMFNCPEWGMEVKTVRLLEQGHPINTITQNFTSCVSLEQVCLSARTADPPLTLEFTLSPNSHWVHLAEVTFSDSNNTCPPPPPPTTPDTIITTPPPPTTPGTIIATPPPPTTPGTIITTLNSSSSTATSLPSTTHPAMNMSLIAPTTTTMEQPTTSTTPVDLEEPTVSLAPTPTTTPSTPTEINIIIPVAVAVPVTLLLLLVMAAVLILWRCKYHTSHYTAKEEASHTTSHTHPPPVAVCLYEETGQALYDSLDMDTYTSIPPQASEEKQEAKQSRTQRGEMENSLHEPPYARVKDIMNDTADLSSDLYSSIAEIRTVTSPEQSQQNTQGDKQKKEELAMNELSETPVDQLYAQVDKMKKEKESNMSSSVNPSPQLLPVNQLYAQVDKKKKSNMSSSSIAENPSPQPPDPEPPVGQLYAQMNKNKKSNLSSSVTTENPSPQPPDTEPPVEKEVSFMCADARAVYSVVNKPSPPQLQLLLEELNSV